MCNQQQKKTISAEHVLSALTKLGFGDFVKEAEEVLSECKVNWQEYRKKDGQKERER